MKDNKGKGRSFFREFSARTYTMLAVLLVLFAGFTLLTSNGLTDLSGSFLSARNLSNLSRQMAIVGVMGLGMVLVIVTGGIDLSVGAVLGFSGAIAAIMMRQLQISPVVAILAALAIGALAGLIQGAIISYLEVPPFIVTLGGQLVFRGILLGITRGQTISSLPDSFLMIGQSYLPVWLGYTLTAVALAIYLVITLRGHRARVKSKLGSGPLWEVIAKWAVISAVVLGVVMVLSAYQGISTPVLIMVVVALFFMFLSEKTTFGRRIYAIGGNRDAARYSGINVKMTTTMVYVIMGLVSGLAGIMLTARLNSATVAAGTNSEMDAISAAIIGGTSMAGGSGKVGGALLGALIMATIENGMSMMNMESYWQSIVKGTILVVAVCIDVRNKNKTVKPKAA